MTVDADGQYSPYLRSIPQSAASGQMARDQ